MAVIEQQKYKSLLECAFIPKDQKHIAIDIFDRSLSYIKSKYDHYHIDIKIASVYSTILLLKKYNNFSRNDIEFYIDSFFEYYNKNFVEYKKSVELLSTDFMFEFQMTFYRMFVDDYIKNH